MRIEGTYTFPAAIERVFAALADAEALGRALPGCERLIQFGPAAEDGAASFEARLRPQAVSGAGAGVYTVRFTGVAARRPAHVRLELRGRGPQGPVMGSGLIDLVGHEGYTVGAYVFDVETAGVLEERGREALAAGQRVARATCERLSEGLRLEAGDDEGAGVGKRGAVAGAADGEARLRVVARGVRTARGRIVTLPAAPSVSPLSANADAWMERISWMATGMVIGMVGLGLLVAVSRWLGERGE